MNEEIRSTIQYRYQLCYQLSYILAAELLVVLAVNAICKPD